MRKTNPAQKALVKNRSSRTMRRISYQELAGGLTAEMAECVRSKASGEFCAPFQLVIVDPQGAVVFEGEVGEDWNVRQEGPARVVRRSHFPAIALLTDRSQVTRTFQIEPMI